jgi:nucleoside-diphosphate-sugar epimerase
LDKKKILILGSSGFIGRAMKNQLLAQYELISATRKDLDLFNFLEVRDYIDNCGPEIVINAAGKVSGIQGNIDNPSELLMNNTQISINVLKSMHELKISRYVQFASACVYPLNSESDSSPSDIGTGRIEPTSQSYAMAKLLAIEAVSAFKKQFGYLWLTVIPSNLYGEGDWDHGADGHVVSMLTKRFIDCSRNSDKSITIWGDGKSLRSFLHVNDLAKAVNLVINKDHFSESVLNVCSKNELSIRDLANQIGEIVGFRGEINFDLSKPSGARRKTLNDTEVRELGWQEETEFINGLEAYVNAMMKDQTN